MFMRVGSLMLAAAGVAMGQEAVKVAPAEIQEKRMTTIIKKENFFSSDRPGLTITLHVDGPAVAGATKYGAIKIEAASDDVGTAITKAKSEFHSDDQFTDISRFGQEDKAAGFDVTIDLSLPPRKASMLTEVKGTLQVLAGGKEKVVTIDNLASRAGKAIDDPVLKAAGISATVKKIDSKKREVQVEYGGTMEAMQEVEIVDAGGRKISNGSMSMTWGGKSSTTYDVSKPVDAQTVMKFHVMAGQKTVPVAFDLKDIKLP